MDLPGNIELLRSLLHSYYWHEDDTVVEKVFRVFDKESKGYIDQQNIYEIFNSSFREYVSKYEVNQMMEEADENLNNVLDLNSFTRAWPRIAKNSQMRKGWNRLRQYQRIKPEHIFNELIEQLYPQCLDDELLGPLWATYDLKKVLDTLVKYTASAIGGPSPWTGRSMKEIHAHVGIQEATWTRFMEIIRRTTLGMGKSPTEAEAIVSDLGAFKSEIVSE